MCCSLGPARLSNTTIYAKEAMHPSGYLVHVVGYENKAQNLASGPNAMILPLPALPGSMGKANVLDTSAAPRILKDMAEAVTPKYRGGELSLGFTLRSTGMVPRVEVFQHGIYTIVLAEDAAAIPDALDQVEPNKRPPLNRAIFEAYSKWYPAWSIALCCFNNEDARHATPMLWWYEPSDSSELFLPALDAHTGDVPDLNERVRIDHTIAVGSYRMVRQGSSVKVNYRDSLPVSLESFLSDRVVGRPLTDLSRMKNGDFFVDVAGLRQGEFKLARRDPLGVDCW